MSQADFDSLVPPGGLDRRRFTRSALGVGIAAAAGPVVAQTAIKTPTAGLTVGEVTIESAGFKMPAYRAAPVAARNAPVVLVISEIFGVHEYIADVANRFARAGYFAIAPELFARAGDPTSYGEIAKLIAEIIMKTPDAQVMGDLDACMAWAQSQGADVSRSAVTGFCWGGRITWLYAAHQARLKAGVAWYGRLVGAANPVWPSHPIDQVGRLQAPVLGLYGGKDDGIPLASVERMKAALQEQGSAAARRSEFVVYPEAPHAFHADYRPTYRKEAAEDGWSRCLAWFKANGAA
ncbi:MAG: carboxymethylenebutenolidase [Betaproteobacteria bacterium]|nr:carboxymethylenebutenolidase [Betaproteobacteria bacterium]NBT11448.1 carboxymethylenebutenolidase [Betaproteobacteria bacterium]NBU50640.1 carboxymethylenebutenolidase [Betaproteobacteria bacterium]